MEVLARNARLTALDVVEPADVALVVSVTGLFLRVADLKSNLQTPRKLFGNISLFAGYDTTYEIIKQQTKMPQW